MLRILYAISYSLHKEKVRQSMTLFGNFWTPSCVRSRHELSYSEMG